MIRGNQLHLRRRANQRLAVLASKKLNSVCKNKHSFSPTFQANIVRVATRSFASLCLEKRLR